MPWLSHFMLTDAKMYVGVKPAPIDLIGQSLSKKRCSTFKGIEVGIKF